MSHRRGGGAPKHWFFIGERENAHRAQARAHFSKCAPRAGESSILPAQDGAHDLESKQNEHRAVARAPFPIKRCTARRREAQKCPTGGAEVLPPRRRAPYMSQLGPTGCPRRALPATILKSTCIWTRQGIGLAQRRMAARGNAIPASRKSVRLLRENEDEGPEVLYRPLI